MTVSLPTLATLLAFSILPAALPQAGVCAGQALCSPAFIIPVRGGGMGGGSQGMGGVGMGGGNGGMGGATGNGMGGTNGGGMGVGAGRGGNPFWNDTAPDTAPAAGSGSKHWSRCVTPTSSCFSAVAGAPKKGTPCYCPNALSEGRLE